MFAPDGQLKSTAKAYGVYPASDGPRLGSRTKNAGFVTRCTVEGEAYDGVIEGESFAAGDAVNVIAFGPVEVTAGATFARGVRLMTDTSGRAIEATSGKYSSLVSDEAATEVGTRINAVLGAPVVIP